MKHVPTLQEGASPPTAPVLPHQASPVEFVPSEFWLGEEEGFGRKVELEWDSAPLMSCPSFRSGGTV
ncbi:MAG: hypothetical protein P4M11_09300 [Candidatus Pacebacteria bacterium]|nr:hypothetical protein [Candidatus Paceibacterota bacterium]